MRPLFLILALLISFSGFAQTFGNAYFKSTHIINSDSTHGELNGTEYMTSGDFFRFRDNGIWKYRLGTTAPLTSNQIMYASGANSLTSESHLTWDPTNNRLIAGTGTTSSGSQNANFGFGTTLTGSWALTVAEASTIRGNNSLSSGWSHEVGDGTNGSFGTLTFGTDNRNFGLGSYVGGIGGQVTFVSSLQRGGFVHAFQQGSVDGKKPATVPYLTANDGAGNISRNTSAQTTGHGSLAQDGFILGGIDHNIPSTSPRTVIIGGNSIKARESDPDQVYVQNFNIDDTPLNDDTLTQILARDGATGQVKYRDASSFVTITNGAGANELMKYDGTNAVASGLFATTNGNIDMGTGLAGSARTIQMAGSASDVGFNLFTKGDGDMLFDTPSTTAQIGFNAIDAASAITVQGKSGLTKAFLVEGSSANDLFEVQLDGDLSADGSGFQYLASTNQIVLTNTALTATTSIFGGEIQLDFPGGSDDVTINNSGFTATGVANYTISASQDLTLSTVSDDLVLAPASDIELSPGGLIVITPGNTSETAEVLGRNTSTGAIERRTDIVGLTYTPTGAAISNVSSVTTHIARYSRIGDQVSVAGAVHIEPTAAASTETIISLTLPIASNFVDYHDAAGNANTDTPTQGGPAIVRGDGIGDVVQLRFTSETTSSIEYFYTYMYTIK